MNGDAGLIDALLKAGADPNERLRSGETALMMASRTGNVTAMKVLLDRGADVNAKETLRGTTALMWAADQGHPAAVKLLIERGADVERPLESRLAAKADGAVSGKCRTARRPRGGESQPRNRQAPSPTSAAAAKCEHGRRCGRRPARPVAV